MRRAVPRLARRLRAQSSPATLAASGVGLLLVAYFAARTPSPELPPELRGPPEAIAISGWEVLPLTRGLLPFARDWASFLGLEAAPWLALLVATLWLARRRSPGVDRFGARLLLATALVLALVPVVAYGYFNDWAMRVSVPALFALQVLVAGALCRTASPRWLRAALAASLLAAGLFPLAQLRQQAQTIAARGEWHVLSAQRQVADLFALQAAQQSIYGFVGQYLARADAPFFLYLAAGPLEPRPIDAAGSTAHGEAPAPGAGVTHSN
jgi:hypothetical protein